MRFAEAQVNYTHARYVAAKIAIDLKRMQLAYEVQQPSDDDILAYQNEAGLLLAHGYLETVTYGFKRNLENEWVMALSYTARRSDLVSHDDHGRVPRRADIAMFPSFLTYSQSWWQLTIVDREHFEATLPFTRIAGIAPNVPHGYTWHNNKRYSSGDIVVQRSILDLK